MPTNDEFFTPENVDEQIDLLSQKHAQRHKNALQAKRIVFHLRQHYTRNPQTHTPALGRAWQRIVDEHQSTKQTTERKGRFTSMQGYREEQQESQAINGQRPKRKRRFLVQGLSTLAAVLLIGVVIGSMAFFLNTTRQARNNTPIVKPVTAVGSGGNPLPKPPHPITGGKCTIDTTTKHPQQSTVDVPGLYIFASNQQSDNILYRYDPQAKKVLWSKKLCNAFEFNGTIEQNGILYLQGVDVTHESDSGMVSYLYALNETDGSAIWGIQFPTRVIPFDKKSPNYGSSPLDLGWIMMPTIANGIIYVVQRTGIVYAYDAHTGGQLWTFDSGRNAWATTKEGNGSFLDPSSVQVVNGVAYFTVVDRIFALDAKSGNKLWSHSFNNALNINQQPAITNGRLYVTAFVPGYGTATNPDTYIYAFDAQTGAQKWVTAKMRGYINGPTAFNGKVHVMSYDSIWYALNPSNGTIESHKNLADISVSAPTVINGALYSITNTTLSELNPDGSAKWSVPITGQYPIINDIQKGIIYVSARGSGVYAYSADNGKLLWHYAGYLPQPAGPLSVTVIP